jgi:glycosyltransferase involved in cell wall biosynthesis
MKYAQVSYGSVANKEDLRTLPNLDAVIFSRPHQDTLLMAYKRMGVPVIVDMDDDFHSIPESHPGYKYVGFGDPIMMTKLENCIALADHLVVTTEELRKRMSKFRGDSYENIHIIPNGWSMRDPYWMSNRSIFKNRIVIGWGGTITHREDFQMCIQPIKKILREHPEAMISIAGDPEIYRLFATVKEKQKMFFPMFPYDLYPIVLSCWDIMLAPLLNDEFNKAKSDIKLVDAGAKGIPFIASDMPVYQEWTKGGVLAKDDEWYEALKLLVENEDIRKGYGADGKKASRIREMLELGEKWREVIDLAITDAEEDLYS